MSITPSLVLGALVICFAVAIGLGLVLHRSKTDEALGAEGMAGAVAFVGGAAAFLLGVLMLSTLDHYNATKATVVDEALAYSGAFESADGLAPEDQAKIQRDLVCLMRSVATYSWAATEAGDLTGSANTHAWRLRASAHANSVVTQTAAQEDSLDTLKSRLISASDSGQQRLMSASSDLPPALWILVFVSIVALTTTLTALLRAHHNRKLAVAALAAVLTLSTAMIWTLKTFDEPFNKSDGVFISPQAINAVMVRLQDTYPGAAWNPCELLADR